MSFCSGASKLSESSPPRAKPIACTETARTPSATSNILCATALNAVDPLASASRRPLRGAAPDLALERSSFRQL
jgi:hypothetical protein